MIKVSQDCVRCGICTEICPSGLIQMEQDGFKFNRPEVCIKCGHCVAICPQGALDLEMVPLDKQVPLDKFPVLEPEAAAKFLRSRRSVRRYKKDTVPKEILQQLLDIARFAPTGTNSQGLSYIVVTKVELMKQITELTIVWMEEQIKNNTPWSKYFVNVVKAYRESGYDIILRGAPNLIIATAPKSFPMGRDNTHFSLSYLELYATTLGLGTCWAGFFEMCAASGNADLYQLLDIPEGMAVTGAVMVGYPLYTFQRLVERNPLQVAWR